MKAPELLLATSRDAYVMDFAKASFVPVIQVQNYTSALDL
jgi:hypothetical protein